MLPKIRYGGHITYRHVENDNGGDKSDTHSSNQPTNGHHDQPSRCSLENASYREDEAASDDSYTTANEVSNVTSDDCPKKGTA